MQLFHCTVFLALLAGATAAEVTPIEKVITLVTDMKTEVEADGAAEAAAYSEFACFCKDTSDTKSTSVKTRTDTITARATDIADLTSTINEEATELAERKQKHEDLNRDLDETTTQCAKDKAEYEAEAADLSKAIQGLKDAIKSMRDSKPSLLSIKATLGKTLEMAEAMSLLTTPKHKAVAAFIQGSAGVDPSDPGYKFHSDEIVDMCENLLTDYKGNKQSLDDEWGKTDAGCTEKKNGLRKSLSANSDAMDALKKSIENKKKDRANDRTELIEEQAGLKDDEQYLKDLTARCEDRANDYDQRSTMRGQELQALTMALGVLQNSVSGKTGPRAFFLQHATVVAKPTAKVTIPGATKAAESNLKSISFLQNFASSGHARNFLGLTQEARKGKALDVLRKEGQRIHSLALTSLAERAATDPFKKIKGLIQKLIERLLTEAKNEATKKGFCDTELGKQRKERDFRFQDANDLSGELEKLEAKRDSLDAKITQLAKSIVEETKALKEATEDREKEKEANTKTIKTAKEGLEGLNEALLILRSFYKQAAKAAFVQASPVDADTAGAGFSGNYKGNQNGMKAIFALLETIQSDFDRTLRKTEEAEATAHREYVGTKQDADASIAGKEKSSELSKEDLETTKTSIDTKMNDLQTAMDLLDNALKELEELKPVCIDTGMSYSERVAKREEEMAALKTALCILDEEGVESACNGR